MSRYTDAFERETKGMEALSTGICPGCDECRSEYDAYTVRDNDGDDGEQFWYFLARDTEQFPSEELAEQASRAAFDDDISNGKLPNEGSFSWSACDLCGSSLGGDRESYHWLSTGSLELRHGFGACTDCIMYIANGDEPSDWRSSSSDTGDDDTDEPTEPFGDYV